MPLKFKALCVLSLAPLCPFKFSVVFKKEESKSLERQKQKVQMKGFQCTIISITIFLCCLAGYVWTYQYLNFSETPEKSDAVVLFVGPEQEQRLKGAHQLMHEGYADTLIIPAYQQVFVMSGGQAVKTSFPNLSWSYMKKYPDFYENTHIEVLEARNMMKKLGLRSAIMVSAPWHMRRINIISSHVFNPEQFQGRCVGSRFLRPESSLLSFSLSDLKIAVTEAVKIVYFIAYEVVV